MAADRVRMRALLRFHGQEGRIRRGQVFETSEARARAYEDRDRPLAVRVAPKLQVATASTTPDHDREPAAAAGVDESAEWPMKMDPETYLSRFPDGPQADLARRITEAP